MHELAIAESVIETITLRMGEQQIRRVSLVVGKLSGVSVDSLSFCFELAAAGTTLADATLNIGEPAGRGRCLGCGAEWELDDFILLCPCGSTDLQILEGQELQIESVEVMS
jgi:hydrogenase nickel incorporation protein HypA/HybF